MVLLVYQMFIIFLLQDFLSVAVCRNQKRNHHRTNQGKVLVFVLAGQSNMEGHGEVDTKDANGNQKNGTLLYQLHDSRTKEDFKILWDDSISNWKTLSDVKVWFQEAKKSDGINGTKIPGTNMEDYTAGDLIASGGFGAGGSTDGRYLFDSCLCRK
jgi:hypothetical protein